MMSGSFPNDQDCDFCVIARGEDPSTEIIGEGPDWIAFFPLSPATPGHTLIIPKAHVRDLWAASPALGAALVVAAIEIGRAIVEAVHPDGMNLITSAGETAEQTVFHLHLHVVPRWQRDGFGKIWPADGRFEDADLENVADLIRDHLATVV
jgi:histidine triad (HIT) family protein